MRLRLLLLLLIGLAVAIVVVRYWRTDMLYQAKLARQVAADAAAPEGAVVFLGNSIIEGLDTSAVAPDTLNLGIGGDTSRGLLGRLDRYSSLASARAIVLEIGINDLVHGDGGEVIANYRRILAQLPKQPRIYLLGLLPIEEKAFVAAHGNLATNAEIARIDVAARELCQRRGNCVLLQPFGAGGLPPEYHTGDGLHLNAAGYAALATAIKAALATPVGAEAAQPATPRP